MGERIINLAKIAGGGLCIASDDGDKVHQAIIEAIKQGDKVILSFQGVEDLTSAFLNAAVGQLYGKYSEEELKVFMLPPVDASSEDLALLKRIVERAKDFFRNPERYKQAAREVLGDDDK